MNDLNFQVKLKPGSTPKAHVLVVLYGKEFTGKKRKENSLPTHRFVWSTGMIVSRKGFKANKKEIKRVIADCEAAYTSLQSDGIPINNTTLKHRIELVRNKIAWLENEVTIWDGVKSETYSLPESTNKLKLDAVLKKELLKKQPDFSRAIATEQSNGANSLFGFWQSIIDGDTKPRNGKTLRKSTLGVKRQSLLLMMEFSPLASFHTMDMLFYNGYVKWLQETKDFDPNTVGKHIRQTKSVLHLAYRNELMDNDRFKYWPVTQESNKVITLSKEELLKIRDVDLPGDENATKRNVRDIFVLACFLGARISDFKSFKATNLLIESGVMFFEYVQEKTGALCKIPVHPIARKIIDDHDGEFPPMISEQNFRYALKDVCEAAEFNDKVIVKIRDGKPIKKVKYKAITPHSARRTFASNLFYGWFTKPLPASLCMRYTGHKSEKSFMLYIGATDEKLNAMALGYFDMNPIMKVS